MAKCNLLTSLPFKGLRRIQHEIIRQERKNGDQSACFRAALG